MSGLTIGVIPARYASERFPGKLLADLNGRSVLEWTWRNGGRAALLDRLIIAAADEKIAEAARAFGAEVEEIFKDCSSGSDRIAEAVLQLERRGESFDTIVNIQGDEPLLDPGTIDAAVERLLSDPEAGVATAVTPIRTEREYGDPSVVKVVLDGSGRAVYFSRAPIPHGWNGSSQIAYHHIGLYVYRKRVLMDFTGWQPCALEKAERLEQLRLIYNGIKIAAVVVESKGMGVDTEEDLGRVRGIGN